MNKEFWWYEEEELRKQAEAEARVICYDRDWFCKLKAGLMNVYKSDKDEPEEIGICQTVNCCTD